MVWGCRGFKGFRGFRALVLVWGFRGLGFWGSGV